MIYAESNEQKGKFKILKPEICLNINKSQTPNWVLKFEHLIFVCIFNVVMV